MVEYRRVVSKRDKEYDVIKAGGVYFFMGGDGSVLALGKEPLKNFVDVGEGRSASLPKGIIYANGGKIEKVVFEDGYDKALFPYHALENERFGALALFAKKERLSIDLASKEANMEHFAKNAVQEADLFALLF